MTELISSLISLALAVSCRAITELALHGKLRWSGKHTSFWGNNSWMRKYNFKGDMYNDLPPNNWYYRFFNIDYKERFPLSATLLVFVTDGMHLCQALFFLLLSLSFSIALELQNWKQYLLVYIGIHVAHFVTYRVLQKNKI